MATSEREREREERKSKKETNERNAGFGWSALARAPLLVNMVDIRDMVWLWVRGT